MQNGRRLCRVLIESAWTYRVPAHISRTPYDRRREAITSVPRYRLKDQIRLRSRYRRLAAGKPKGVVTTAITYEMVGFIRAIACIAQPALQSCQTLTGTPRRSTSAHRRR